MAIAPAAPMNSLDVARISATAATRPSHSGGPPLAATGPRMAPTSATGMAASHASTRFVIDTILALRDRGGAVLYISSELDEVLSVGDRIGVISEGVIVGVTDRADVDIVRLGLLMAGTAHTHDSAAAA